MACHELQGCEQQQLEEGAHRVALGMVGEQYSAAPVQRRVARAFRLMVAAACLTAAAVVICKSQDGWKRTEALSDYASDTMSNVFSSHYMSPAKLKYFEEHPSVKAAPKKVVQKAQPTKPTRRAPPNPLSLIGINKDAATSFLEDLPGMSHNEFQELVKAAESGHAPSVAPIAKPKPKPQI